MPASKNRSSPPVFPQFNDLDQLGQLLTPAKHLPMLITGIAGVAGYNAFAYFRQKYGDLIVGQRPKNNWPLSGNGIYGADIDNPNELKQLLALRSFKTVVNCGGSCALKGCELDPEMARRVNVQSVESLVSQLSPETRFVHLSIDLVFAGNDAGNHCETDEVTPVTVYGSTMVQAENLLRQRFPSACVLRISLPMGISFNGHAGAIDWIQSRFVNNKPATLYYDEVRTPVYVECLNEVIEEVICSDLAGVFHAGGNQKLSLFQIAQIVNLVGGYDPNLLMGCYRIEAGPVPPRAGNVAMDSRKLANSLGRQPFMRWPHSLEFVPVDRKWHYRRDFQVSNRVNQLYFRP